MTVVADASELDTELVTSLGADVVLPRGEGFAAAVRERLPDGVDGMADGSVQGAQVLPAADAAEAHRRLEAGGGRG